MFQVFLPIVLKTDLCFTANMTFYLPDFGFGFNQLRIGKSNLFIKWKR